jgi:RecA-family ATPase
MDRASGSGVFARDPDALIDLVELDISDALKQQEESKAICAVYRQFLENANPKYWDNEVSKDDIHNAKKMEEHAQAVAIPQVLDSLHRVIADKLTSLRMRTAWRVEGTLREYPKFEPLNMWFQYPIHKVDDSGVLQDVDPEGDRPPWHKATDKRKSKATKERRSKADEFADAVSNCNMGEPPTVKHLVEWFSSIGNEVPDRTVRDWVKKYGYVIDKNNGNVIVKNDGDDH